MVRLVAALTHHETTVTGLATTPRGLAFSTSTDKKLAAFELRVDGATNLATIEPTGHFRWPTGLVAGTTASGNWVMTGALDGRACWWRVANAGSVVASVTRTATWDCREPITDISSGTFGGSEVVVAVTRGGSLVSWSNPGDVAGEQGDPRPTFAVKVTNLGLSLACVTELGFFAADFAGNLWHVDPRGDRQPSIARKFGNKQVTSLAWLGDKGTQLLVGLDAGPIIGWNFGNGGVLRPTQRFPGHAGGVEALSPWFDEDGGMVGFFSGGLDGDLAAWSLKETTPVARVKLPGGHARRLCFHEGLGLLIGGDTGSHVTVWEAVADERR
ncbi:MAG: hypothetical protein Kow0069_00980 [Promethearchaeota archaeon]